MTDSRLTVKLGRSARRKTRDAAAEALAELGGSPDEFALVLVYCSVQHKHERLLAEVKRQLGSAPIIGCTTTGEITSQGFMTDGLVIAGLGSDQLVAGIGRGQNVFEQPAAAARAAVEMAQQALQARGGLSRPPLVMPVGEAGFSSLNTVS